MIKVTCVMCKRELSSPGALVFSPPVVYDGAQATVKYHVCTDPCWNMLVHVLVNQAMSLVAARANGLENELVRISGELKDAQAEVTRLKRCPWHGELTGETTPCCIRGALKDKP